jgi:hypothetical protein
MQNSNFKRLIEFIRLPRLSKLYNSNSHVCTLLQSLLSLSAPSLWVSPLRAAWTSLRSATLSSCGWATFNCTSRSTQLQPHTFHEYTCRHESQSAASCSCFIRFQRTIIFCCFLQTGIWNKCCIEKALIFVQYSQ